jgi:hypothetical protein
MLRPVLIVAAVAALAVAGVVEGVRSNRWGEPADLRAAADRLNTVPAVFGTWTSTDQPMPEKVLKVAEAIGHVSRVYRDSRTGAEVSVLLLCGPAGPIASHTPDVCYAGNGFTMQGRQVPRTISLPGGSAASYWTARFAKDGPGEQPLEVSWAWGTDGDWEAAENPRRDLALKPALYKLYVARSIPPGAQTPAADPVAEFLSAFLPEVKKVLSPAAPSAAAK